MQAQQGQPIYVQVGAQGPMMGMPQMAGGQVFMMPQQAGMPQFMMMPQGMQMVDLGNGMKGMAMAAPQAMQPVQVPQTQGDASKAGAPQPQQPMAQPQIMFAQPHAPQQFFQVAMPQAGIQATTANGQRPVQTGGAPQAQPTLAVAQPSMTGQRPAQVIQQGGQQYVLVEVPQQPTFQPQMMMPYGMQAPMAMLGGGIPMMMGGGQIMPTMASAPSPYIQMQSVAPTLNVKTREPRGAQAPGGKRGGNKAPPSVQQAPQRAEQAPPSRSEQTEKNLNPAAAPFVPGGAAASQQQRLRAAEAPATELKMAQTVRAYLRQNCGGGSVPLTVLQAEMDQLQREGISVVTRWTEFCLHNSIKVFSYTDTEIEAHKLQHLFFQSPLEQRVTLVENANYIDADRNMISTITGKQTEIFEAAKFLKPESFWVEVEKVIFALFPDEAHRPSSKTVRTVLRNMVAAAGAGIVLPKDEGLPVPTKMTTTSPTAATTPQLAAANATSTAEEVPILGGKEAPRPEDDQEDRMDLQDLVNDLLFDE